MLESYPFREEIASQSFPSSFLALFSCYSLFLFLTHGLGPILFFLRYSPYSAWHPSTLLPKSLTLSHIHGVTLCVSLSPPPPGPVPHKTPEAEHCKPFLFHDPAPRLNSRQQPNPRSSIRLQHRFIMFRIALRIICHLSFFDAIIVDHITCCGRRGVRWPFEIFFCICVVAAHFSTSGSGL